jgi:uncharacterized protein YdhG (YjbR/CyaY superfamily)
MPTRKVTKKPADKKAAPAKRSSAMGAPAKNVDEYIASAPNDKRAALTKLRNTIKAAAPKANEIISYGMAGYKQGANRVAYFAYWKGHIALYGTSYEFIEAHAAELKPYVQSKGTIQFPADKPLPYPLVTKIVKARVAEIEKAG